MVSKRNRNGAFYFVWHVKRKHKKEKLVGRDIQVCTKCHFLRLGISAPLIPKPLSTLECHVRLMVYICVLKGLKLLPFKHAKANYMSYGVYLCAQRLCA